MEIHINSHLLNLYIYTDVCMHECVSVFDVSVLYTVYLCEQLINALEKGSAYYCVLNKIVHFFYFNSFMPTTKYQTNKPWNKHMHSTFTNKFSISLNIDFHIVCKSCHINNHNVWSVRMNSFNSHLQYLSYVALNPDCMP